MASSSVSQESLDMDDFDTSARRNRIRVHRGHSGRGSMPHRGPPDRGDGGDQDREGRGDHHNGDVADSGGGSLGLSSHLPGDHESPTRGAAARLKDKRSRPNHMKGKPAKDKRKLREKRRSTGVVHCMPSTESTGDSLDDEDDDEDVIHDTKKNTLYNEGSASSHHHQSTYEGRHSSNPAYSHQRRNKSPSDLEADLEDNQDYDSTVSHSETNLTLIGRSESTEMSTGLPGRQQAGSTGGSKLGGGGSSRYSPESSRAFKFGASNVSSDADSSRTNTPSTSSSSSVLSRYREVESPRSGAGTNPGASNNGGAQEPDSPRQFSSTNTTTTATDSTQNPQQIHPRPVGFSVFRDRDNNSSASGARSDKPSYPSYVSSAARFRDRDGGGSSSVSGVGSVHSRVAGYQPFRQYNSSSSSSAAAQQQQNEAVAQLERQLEKERQDNKKLQQQLEEKDKKIAELEKAIELLNSECDGLDEDNLKLQEENKALIRAMSKLTSNV